MSFPVAGTLMIEPTESEDLAELDRFVDAMIAIRAEIDRVARGGVAGRRQPAAQRAAHRRRRRDRRRGQHAYSRDIAAFPVARLRHDKYWPPVGRIDGVYGDRNVMCSCPPIEAYE